MNSVMIHEELQYKMINAPIKKITIASKCIRLSDMDKAEIKINNYILHIILCQL